MEQAGMTGVWLCRLKMDYLTYVGYSVSMTSRIFTYGEVRDNDCIVVSGRQ